MSADKRRRARVQGGWSAPQKPKVNSKPTLGANNSAGAGWLGKTVDTPIKEKFVYQNPDEYIREKPEVRVIDEPGVFDLSNSPNGVSRIRLFYNFVDPMENCWMFDTLFHELPWRQKTNSYDGKPYLEPRMTAWYGEMPYSYSRITQEANPEFHPLILTLKSRLEEITGITFNSVLCNLYRSEKDSIDWHSDDEKALGINPTIASLSFGDTRNFELRRKPTPEEKGDYTYMQHVRVPLPSASLLIMEGATQTDWQHHVPKEYHDRQPRINLTFRVTSPE